MWSGGDGVNPAHWHVLGDPWYYPPDNRVPTEPHGVVAGKDETLTTPVHIILNPQSGSGSGLRCRPEVEEEFRSLGIDFTLEETVHRGHAVELAYAAARRGARTIIAAGGDGTVHEVVNGILRARDEGVSPTPILGVVPIGTGNDFVKNLTGGIDRSSAYRAIASGQVRNFDLGRVRWEGGTEYFMNGVGTGIDVQVVRQITRLPRLPGVVSYLVGLLRALVTFRPLPLRILVDGVPTEQRVMIVAVGNGFCLAGGFHLFPDALPDDGHLDLCVVDELNLPQIAVVLPRVLRGRHGGHPRVTLSTARSVVIEALGDEPLFFQVDGELREPVAAYRLEIEIAHAVLPVWTGPGARLASGPNTASPEDLVETSCSI